MTWTPCTCLPGPAGDCLPTSCSGTGPSAPSSGTATAAPCCESEPQTAGFHGSRCGRETCGNSLPRSGKAEWIASMRAGLASILHGWDAGQDWTESTAGCGPKWSELLAVFDRDSCSWKTAGTLFAVDFTSFWPTLPDSGMTCAGQLWGLPPWVRLTSGTGGGRWPTPQASDWKGSSKPGQRRGQLSETVGGIPHPELCEWLMGMPRGWTERRGYEAAAMLRYRLLLPLRG